MNEVPKLRGETAFNHMKRVQRAKSIGLVPGVHDMLFLWNKTLYCFDVKVDKDNYSDEQLLFAHSVATQGAQIIKIPSFEFFQETILKILSK